jgi:hypothetical protein
LHASALIHVERRGARHDDRDSSCRENDSKDAHDVSWVVDVLDVVAWNREDLPILLHAKPVAFARQDHRRSRLVLAPEVNVSLPLASQRCQRAYDEHESPHPQNSMMSSASNARAMLGA